MDKKNDPKLFEIIRRDNIEQQFGGTAPNLPVEPENGFFPPRMPSEKFIKDEENPDDILITEEQYINKYKNGEIPEGCISPYLYDQLKEEENKKDEINEPEILEQKVENSPIAINKSEPKVEIIRSRILMENIRNKENLEKEKILMDRKTKINRIRHFMNNDWDFDDELTFPQYHNINSSTLKEGNIISDINKFGIKKKNFFSNLSSFNN